jgi:thioredoxin reductase (NADPH)
LINNPDYEAIIVGGGPAGLTAGLYTARARLNSLLIEKGVIGGQIVNAELVENFPGFPEGINGYELGQALYQQTTKYGLKTLLTEVTGLEFSGEQKVVNTLEGAFTTKAVVIANGSKRVKLEIPGEEEFTGKGVSYCATCDAAFFTELPVAVVGGGNAAITEALQIAKYASKVVVIHRRKQLRATRILQEKAFSTQKIEFIWNSVVEAIEGTDCVKRVKLHNLTNSERSTLYVDGIFISIGLKPNSDYLNGILPLDDAGHVIVNEKMETQIPGIFAAGDIRHNSGWQAITAAGDGATSAIFVEKYISE